MRIKQKSAWQWDGSSGGNISISLLSLDKGTIKLNKSDSQHRVTERLSLSYGGAGVSYSVGGFVWESLGKQIAQKNLIKLPVDGSMSTPSFPDVGDVYVTDRVNGDLTADDFEGLCFINSASISFAIGASHTVMFFGIPWTKVPKQLVKGIALNFVDWKSYVLGPGYTYGYKAAKFIFGNGELPNVLRPLASEAKGIIVMKGLSVSVPVPSAGISVEYGYMSSHSTVMPWEWTFPDSSGGFAYSYQSVTRDESVIRIPGDVLFGFDKDWVGSGTGGIEKAEATLSIIAYIFRQIRPRIMFTEGHTDSVGTPDYNIGLSIRRAEAVQRWLETKGKLAGIPIKPVGFGLTKPIADNRTDKGRELNRRVEFRFYG
jgi:outer membrane protein OmpA-like peptidoglycan-associated protein